MPFVLLILGEMLLVSGIKGTQDEFFALVKSDFTGSGSFIYWLAAIGLIGSLGYVPSLKTFSNTLLILILLVLVIRQDPNKLFGGFTNALQSSTSPEVKATSNINTTANDNGFIPPVENSPSVKTALDQAGQSGDFITSAVNFAKIAFA